ncbi:PucR family transcriptional regulator ligand-binding domain-containing protein [Pseudonocardia nematodicida]|uniref:PucR family transcriptional regulator ligand-binding domain-containing protein n=1 Tax=Pseudonocardia nematodicida TaxID=1206997 RepID=A0ABV1KER8_9PSEU
MPLTVSDVLQVPALAVGRPVVRAGRAGLGTEVRWVHVSEQRRPAGTLSGGDLVLSIGAAIADPATDHADYLAELRDAGAVALVVELGQHLTTLPSTLVQAARRLRFPLVELRDTVRFIEVTEVVHARLLNDQYTRLQFTQTVTETFRSLLVAAAGVDEVVERAARLLGAPVVLEDLAHRAIGFAGEPARSLLRDWGARSRQAHATAPGTGTGWPEVPVGPPGERWGRLVVPRRVTDPGRASLVLRQAGETVTVLTRIAAATPATALEPQGRLLADLLDGRAGDDDERARAQALGFDPTGPFLVLVATTAAPGDRVVRDAVGDLRLSALVGVLRPGRVGVVVSGADAETPAHLRAHLDHDRVPVLATAARVAPTFDRLPGLLIEALRAADVALAFPQPGAFVWRPRDLGARGLAADLGDDRRLAGYVDDQLGPLLGMAAPRREPLLATLRAYLDSGGRMTGFAERIGVGRATAYGRLEKLAGVLDRDLTDPYQRTSIHLALLAYDGGRAQDGGATRPTAARSPASRSSP